MADDESKPIADVAAEGQIQVSFPEQHFDVLYSDQAFVSHTPVGFTIDFAQMTPQVGISRVVARVGMSATHLKLLVGVLSQNLQHFEENFGAVNLTPEMVKQHDVTQHHIGFHPDDPKAAAPGADTKV